MRQRLNSALRLLRHRGPDDHGTAFFQSGGGEVGLGSTRLAILDTSAAGHMPMLTADGDCAIVFNGEIYDAGDHGVDLERKGVRFRSRSDTEVLLYGLAIHGPAFLDRVDGMYAFAFWNSSATGSLLLARDRFGEKPLFIAEEREAVLWASEPGALIELAGHVPEIDPEALRHVIEWGYPAPHKSVFSGFRKLSPGSWKRYGDGAGEGALRPLEGGGIDGSWNLKAAGVALREALEHSVRARLVADVPVGVFLSGGLDSAGVAAIASRCIPRGSKLNTYTVGYSRSPASEIPAARATAEYLGTCHHEILLDDRHMAALPLAAAALGEPLGDPAALPTYFLAEFARQSSTVLLTGEGSDEMLYGYPRYLLHDLADAAHGRRRDPWLRIAAGFFARARCAAADSAARDTVWKGFGAYANTVLDGGPASVFSTEIANGSATSSRADDVSRWLPENVLTRVDRMTMAASIEARAPYLGREVARLGMHLPERVLRRLPYGKIALRIALRGYLPFSRNWGWKRPFAVPLVTWMRGPLRHIVEDVFFGPRTGSRNWFRRDGLRRVGAAVLQGDAGLARFAWTLLMTELWARVYVDGEPVVRPDARTFTAVHARPAFYEDSRS